MEHNTSTFRYEELDALRGLAALMVVFFHFTKDIPQSGGVFMFGTTGVDLFFIISGFVIFMSLSKVRYGYEFVINRVSRLYPTYWASVSLTFLWILLYFSDSRNAQNLVQYLGNMTMFQFYLKIPDLDGSYWTMIIEMIFYIGMLLLFQTGMLRHVVRIGLTLAVLMALLSTFFYDFTLVRKVMMFVPLLQFVPLFLAGIVFYKIYTQPGNHAVRYGVLVVCLLCQILLFHHAGKSDLFITQGQYALILTCYFGLFVLFVNHRLRFIVSKPSLFLGKISFALYLIHQHIGVNIFIPFFTNRLHLNFWVAAFLITLPLVILMATMITYWVEVPMSRRLKESLRSLAAMNRSADLSL